MARRTQLVVENEAQADGLKTAYYWYGCYRNAVRR